MDVPADATLQEVRNKVASQFGVPIAQQRLFAATLANPYAVELQDDSITAADFLAHPRTITVHRVSNTTGTVATIVGNRRDREQDAMEADPSPVRTRARRTARAAAPAGTATSGTGAAQPAGAAARKSAKAQSRMYSVYVRDMTGKTTPLQVRADSAIEDLKHLYQDKDGTPPDQQRLIWNGWQLEDKRTLAEYGIGADEKLHLLRRLRGC